MTTQNDAADRAAKISSLLNTAGRLAERQGDPELTRIIGDAALVAFDRVQRFAAVTGREIAERGGMLGRPDAEGDG